MSRIAFRCIFLAMLVISVEVHAGPKEDQRAKETGEAIERLNREVDQLDQSMTEVRRDQLTYQIERDLLKEAYGSNLSTINTVITIVLGVFTVFGFLGLGRIREVQEEYKDELERLTGLRTEYQATLATSKKDAEDLKLKYAAVNQVNEAQDKRLKVLEIQEKAKELIKTSAYSTALEFIAIGLSIDPENYQLLRLKAGCHGKLSEFREALATTEQLILQTKGDVQVSQMLNAAEFALLSGNIQRYDELEQTLAPLVAEQGRKALHAYFRVLRAYQTDNSNELIAALDALAPLLDSSTSGQIRWDFEELGLLLQSKPDSPAKTAMQSIPAAVKAGTNAALISAIAKFKRAAHA